MHFAQGNSAVFLFYAYARIRALSLRRQVQPTDPFRNKDAFHTSSEAQSIQRKAGIDVHSIPSNCLQARHVLI